MNSQSEMQQFLKTEREAENFPAFGLTSQCLVIREEGRIFRLDRSMRGDR